ncbi:MAG: flagellar hook-length control protein FliK [Lachnospiraceae bacterium]|nr:flagellar hook-length control protein FliK [Lachnospiraceae bacterium]
MGLLDHMMANLYKPPKQEKPAPLLPKHFTPAKAATMANQTTVTQGQFLKGEVLDLRANQIMVLLENGATVSARTDGTLNLSIGQTARFFVAQTTEEQILLKLAQEETPAENPMIDKALSAANITKTERSVSIVTELLAHKQPVNEASIRHYLSTSAKYPELPVKDLILMELHHIPVTKETVEQFVNYQDRNAKLLTQTQDMLKQLTETIEKLPEGSLKQEAVQELTQLFGKVSNLSAESSNIQPESYKHPETADSFVSKNMVTDSSTRLQTSTELPQAGTTSSLPEQVSEYAASSTISPTPEDPAIPQVQNPADIPAALSGNSQAVPHQTSADTSARSLTERIRPQGETLMEDFLNSFLLSPEDIADGEKVQKYYDELNEKLTKLEQLSQKLAENTTEKNTAAAPKQMRQNLSFMEAVNQVFPYVQLPLKFREGPAHGELYVYEKKKALKPSDTLSALLHLELEALGTTDIFVTLSGTHVTTRFSMTDKESGDLVRTELPKLTEALSARGYTLQSEVSVREPAEEESTPTLLEQFLEEHAPGGLNRYTFDIRA